ncbi:UBP1-associated protein 2B-like [Actinidia eriantha]|uniref:UBP1-associated protein 2B-like n=1 Tax=Actinidia eriantha TaxID=165200 RepID=UPI002588B40F|nr:UBP1-associated protein 2B-like [Actinidia eriantha]XP_057501953.1 UBP1-associated protein 2B-like [Actinidia eriantha]XP_057501954.1 UBP1-associated protein 2B-like [Actinidia eriantha]XP_057501956.1 UBP1-associated protein 2B-like [Actinidia eriantha]
MARTSTSKKRKVTKKQPEITEPEKKKKKPIKKKPQIQTDSDTDSSSSSSSSSSDKIQKLLDPYTKDQLIAFLVDAAASDAALFRRLRDAADGEVSHRKIFVYGLGWDTTRETLVAAFEPFGEIEDCHLVTDKVTGRAKGYAFVLFKTRRAAAKALKNPSKKIGNRMASCQLASAGPGPSPQSQDGSNRKIYVSNVPADVDREKLRSFFEKFGEIESGPIGFDMYTGKSRGFALFVYKSEESVRKAIQEPYKVFEGQQLHCKKAAEGKDKVGGGAAAVTTVVQPVQGPVLAALAAAQNLALLGQNPMYSGYTASPNPGLDPIVGSRMGGFVPGVIGSGQMAQVGGFPGYGAAGSHGLGSLGGGQSVLGSYGSGGPALQGLQHPYPISQIGQTSSAPGTSGSFSGYP